MSNYRKVFKCNCCGSEFNEPSYNDPAMCFLEYKKVFNRESVGNGEVTLGVNGEEICMCNKCTKIFEEKLKEMGFEQLYEGCSSCRL